MLVAVYLPGVLGDARGSAGRVALLGIAMFVPVIVVWRSYSADVVGPGGLYAFVRAGAGKYVAWLQAALWVVSYLLYLVYTATYLAYDVMPAAFGWGPSSRPVAQVLVAVVVAAVALLPLRHALTAVAVLAITQLVLVAGLAVAAWRAPTTSDVASTLATASPHDLLLAGGNLSILFICSSLALFVGGEVVGGSVSIRRELPVGWAIVAMAVLVVALPMARLAPGLLSGGLPGLAVADAARMRLLADAIGIGVVASVVGVMVAEFLALSRLLHALTAAPVPRWSRVLAVVLVAGSVVALVNPERVYNDLLKPSLIALWLAQLLVFVSYPFFIARRSQRAMERRGSRVAGAAVLAIASSALMLFGLWSTIVNQVAS